MARISPLSYGYYENHRAGEWCGCQIQNETDSGARASHVQRVMPRGNLLKMET
jgi:hypothetical protein